MVDDDGIRHELGFQAGILHRIERLLLAPRPQKQAPGDVSRGGGATEARIAVDQELRGGVWLAARRKPIDQVTDLFAGRRSRITQKVRVKEEGNVVVFRSHPRWPELGNIRAGVLKRHHVIRSEALFREGPILGANKYFHREFGVLPPAKSEAICIGERVPELYENPM